MPTTVTPGTNALQKVVITSGDSVVEIYRQGATITRYAKGSREIIFTSASSFFQRGKAIRGGVPICWPWFGPHPSDPTAPQHGFVRAMEWDVTATTDHSATLTIQSSPETKKHWPHEFKLVLTVTVDPQGLTFALTTTNTCQMPFTYGEALHTYFTVGDISQTTVSGFKGLSYLDKVDNMARKVETNDVANVTGETDRVYLGAKGPHVISSPKGKITVSKSGSADTVFWNPWQKKAESLPDLAGGQWPCFVCVEAVNTGEHLITLSPGQSHTIECRVEPG